MSDTKPNWADMFVKFHNANPGVYEALVHSARTYIEQTGNDKCGMSLLFGGVRWLLSLKTDGDEFAINSNCSPFYSRLIMDREADLKGLFDLRSSIADNDGSWYGECN